VNDGELERALDTALRFVESERNGLAPSELAEAADAVRSAVRRLPGPSIDLVALPARSSLVLRVATPSGPVVVKVPLIPGHRSLEVAALGAWGPAGLTPRLLSGARDLAVTTSWLPGVPLYAAPPAAEAAWTALTADWYTRCHRALPVPAHFDAGTAVGEWRSWLDGHHELTVAHADSAARALRELCCGLPTVVTHADPNRGNFLYDHVAGSVCAVDPLPAALPVEVVVARAALQLRPDDPASFVGAAALVLPLDRSVVDDALTALAIFTLDWADDRAVRELAARFASSHP